MRHCKPVISRRIITLLDFRKRINTFLTVRLKGLINFRQYRFGHWEMITLHGSCLMHVALRDEAANELAVLCVCAAVRALLVSQIQMPSMHCRPKCSGCNRDFHCLCSSGQHQLAFLINTGICATVPYFCSSP